MLVYDNILLNNGFVMPYSMNIDEYSILFFDNADIDLLAFFEIFLDNDTIDMVSHLMFFLHSTHTFNLSSSHRHWNPLSSLIGL
jgi:hypothetical protein